jgi:hypothetical protein
MGTGAEFTTTRGALTSGAFVQDYRWTPGAPTEESAWISAAADSLTRATATTTLRQSGAGTIGILGLAGSMRAPLGARAEVEGAVSDSAGPGGAWRARLSGDTLGVRYDASVLHGGDAFAGPARGTLVASAAIATHLPYELDLGTNVTRRTWASAVSSVGRMGQAFSTATVTATWRGATALEYGWLSRRDEGAFDPVDGAQHGVRLSSVAQVGGVGVSGSVEHGTMRAAPGAPSQAYTLLSASVRTGLGRLGSIGLSGSRSIGHTLTGANGDVLAASANAQLHLPYAIEAGVTFSAQRATFGMLDTSGAWFSIMDARVERRFDNGATVGLHARALQNPGVFGAGNSSAVYLEYRMPFRLPTGRSREPGRAVGQVMDADRGEPVAGVLVRLGDQAAVSDRNGYVRFSGLDARVQRVTVDPTGVTAGAILVGDMDVDMRAANMKPAEFAVAVTRGAQVAAHVGREDADTFTDQPDGPAPVAARRISPMHGVLVALQGARDTLYQVSDARGNVQFGTVAPGRWTLAVQQPDDAYLRFARERVEITVAAGDRTDVQFVLVPVERQVKMMDGGGALRARRLPDAPAKPGAKP